MAKSAIKGGGVRRLMAKVMKNYHFFRALGRTNHSPEKSANLAGHPVFPREEGEIQGRTIGIYPEIKSAAATNLILADRGDPLRFKLQFKIFRILSMSAKLSECTTALSRCRG